MANERTVKITILGDAAKAVPAFRQTIDAAGDLETKVDRLDNTLDDSARGTAALDRNLGGLDGALRKASAGATLLGGALAGAGVGIALKALEGASALFGQLTGSVGDARESALVMAQLDAVLTSMGGASGMTAESVSDLADRLSELTGIDDEAIVSAQSLLLTFGNIGKDVFPETTQAVLDMSTAMGTDFKSSAIMVGKALNDPIAGISALTRVGVQFTDQQKEQIEAMVAAGDTAGAQRVILAELQKQFGGSAAAAATDSQKLATAWGNIREEIGGRLLPYVERATGALLAMVKSERFKAGLDRIMDGVAGLAGLIERAYPPVQRFVTGIVSAGRAVIEAAQSFLAGRTNLGEFIGGIEIMVGTTLGNLGQLGERVGPIIGGFGRKLLDFLAEVTPQIVAQMRIWGAKLGDWIGETAIPWLREKLGDLGTAFAEWADTTGRPAVIAKMKEFGAALGDWVTETAIPWLRENLPKWLLAYGEWADTTGRPWVIAKMKELALAMGDFVVNDAIPYLRENLPKWYAALDSWLTNTVEPAVREKLKELARAFGNWIVDDAIPYLQTQLPLWWEALRKWLAETAVPAVVEAAKNLGRSMVAGMIQGLRDEWETLKSELRRLAEGLPEPVRRALGISSPSTVFAEAVGMPIVDGVVAGLRAQRPALDRALGGLVAVPEVGRGGGRALPLGGGVAGAAMVAATGFAGGAITVNINLPNVTNIGDRGQIDILAQAMRRELRDVARGGLDPGKVGA